MTGADGPLAPPRSWPSHLVALKRLAASPRFLVYVSCTLLVVLISYWLGKDMLWDTMDYHVYAGFSALHDRFSRDYFAAGPQGYFNPYAYVPFYLLLRSPLTPLEDASILAVFQSAILWLTYELAMRVVAPGEPKTRVTVGILAVGLAFANPVLINQFGSSFADVTTAEIALAGWLALLSAVWTPGSMRVLGAALLLGAASALKPTNAVHAVSAAVMLLFIPGSWRRKFRYGVLFAVTLCAGLVLVSLPWSMHLQQHFGNPVFPLLNGVFRSPEYPTGVTLDHRFLPTSLAAALLRPFTMVEPVAWVHFEMPAPDLRYAVLLVVALLLLVRQVWARVRKGSNPAKSPQRSVANRALTALGCTFLADWVLWLTASGNSRYFIPAACAAAVLCMALIFRLFDARLAVRNYVLGAVLGVQFFLLCVGTEYRDYLPWEKGPWYSVSVPAALASHANLYFLVGRQTHSFIIPDMPSRSGFVNLNGVYALKPQGPNGRRVDSLIRRYAPHLQVLWFDGWNDAGGGAGPAHVEKADDALEPFGLKADAGRCSTIVVHGIHRNFFARRAAAAKHQAVPADTEYLVSCHVLRYGSAHPAPLPGQRAADRAFDHLEDACPALFQPRRPADILVGGQGHGYVFARRYASTGMEAWIAGGSIRFAKLIGGREEDAGPEKLWEKAPLRVVCGLEGQGFLTLLKPRP